MEYTIRHIRQEEWPLIEDFLLGAIFLPPGFEGQVDRSVIERDPKCRAAWKGFGTRHDDRALVAVIENRVIGACWVRTTDEYGHIDASTPSFSISLVAPYRGQGIGSALMETMLDELRETGYARASLSVQKENPAYRLYRRLGFNIIGDGADETEWLMVRDLTDDGIHTATPADAASIHDLVQETIEAAYQSCYSPAIRAAFSRLHSLEAIETDIAKGRVRIFKDKGRVVGTGTLDEGHITRVFVTPDEEGKGVGTSIMDALEKAAAPYGTVELDTSIPARSFYLNRGYEVASENVWEVEARDGFSAARITYETLIKTISPRDVPRQRNC